MSYAPIDFMDVLPIVIFVLAIAATIFMNVYPDHQSSSDKADISVLDDA